MYHVENRQQNRFLKVPAQKRLARFTIKSHIDDPKVSETHLWALKQLKRFFLSMHQCHLFRFHNIKYFVSLQTGKDFTIRAFIQNCPVNIMCLTFCKKFRL